MRIIVFIIVVLLTSPLFAQDNIQADSLSIEEENDLLSAPNMPRRALLYSAILPGLGQFYNKQYWKIPIAIGGFVTTGLLINSYNEQYTFAKNELYLTLEDPDYVPRINLSQEQLRRRVELFNRERDYMMVMTAVFYMLQIVDAHIDAHLEDFEKNPEMDIAKLLPSIEPVANTGSVGVGLIWKF